MPTPQEPQTEIAVLALAQDRGMTTEFSGAADVGFQWQRFHLAAPSSKLS